MTFESNKNLSAVGTLLLVIGFFGVFIPYAGILALVGIILLMIGLKGLASFYKEQGIFSNALYAIITGIVGAVVAVGAVVISGLAALASLGIDLANIEDWVTLGVDMGAMFLPDVTDFSLLWSLISVIIVGLLILFVTVIISVYFFRKSMNQLSTKSGVGLFGTAGLLMIVGAVLTIVVVGFILIWIGLLIATIAFFQMKQAQV